MIIELRGGRLDGLRVRTSLAQDFLWVKDGRCYRQRRKGAEPYRSAHVVRAAKVLHFDPVRQVTLVRPAVMLYDFVGHTHSYCVNCESVHSVEDDHLILPYLAHCQLCGSMLTKLSDLR